MLEAWDTDQGRAMRAAENALRKPISKYKWSPTLRNAGLLRQYWKLELQDALRCVLYLDWRIKLVNMTRCLNSLTKMSSCLSWIFVITSTRLPGLSVAFNRTRMSTANLQIWNLPTIIRQIPSPGFHCPQHSKD